MFWRISPLPGGFMLSLTSKDARSGPGLGSPTVNTVAPNSTLSMKATSSTGPFPRLRPDPQDLNRLFALLTLLIADRALLRSLRPVQKFSGSDWRARATLTLRSTRRFPERLAMALLIWATEANSAKAKPTRRLVRELKGIEIESLP